MIGRLVLLICLLASTHAASAQRPDMKSLEMDAGLSSNYVMSIAEDKHGFIWFATEEGLDKFDGLTFRTFYKSSRRSNGLTGNELNCVMDDPRDPVMWIGTQREGLNAYNYDTGTFVYYRHDNRNPNSIVTNDITSIKPARDGNIWVTTFWEGFDLLDKPTGRFTHFNIKNVKGMPSNQLWSLLDGGHATVYLGHTHHGMSIVDTDRRTAQNFQHDTNNPYSISGNEVYCIYQDKQGRIWVGTNHGLDLFYPQEKRFIHFTDNGKLRRRVFDIKELSGNKLWVGTELGGVAIIDLGSSGMADKRPHVTYIAHASNRGELTGGTVRTVHEDKFGNVWLGLYGEGINFISNQQPLFKRMEYQPSEDPFSMTDKTAMSLCTDKGGLLWAGTDYSGIDIFNANRQRIKNIPMASSVQALFCDSQGRIWVGLFAGGAYAIENGKTQRVKGLRNTEDVRAFVEAKNGLIYTSTSSGVYIINPNTNESVMHADIGNNLVRSIALDRHGRIFVATFGNGLFIMPDNLKGPIIHYDTGNGFTSNTVNHVMTDRKGNIWVATGEGLVMFRDNDTKRYDVYNAANGLNNIHIRSMSEDESGNIWVGTNKGLSCLVRETKTFFNYLYKDNIPVGNFMAGSAAHANDGTIFFGSNNGICYFKPKQVLGKRIAPPAIINSLTINNPTCQQDSIIDPLISKTVRLNYSDNTFTVSFCVKNFALANEIEYAYRMEGLSQDWTGAGTNTITFRNLQPGKYRLEVRSRFRNQPWNTQAATLNIKIAPPMWLTWWAKLGYTLLGLSIVWFFLRNYKHRVHLEYLLRSEKKVREKEKKLNEERMRFFTNITHELRTPLTLVMAPLEDLTQDKSISAEVKRKIRTIHGSSAKLYDLISKILEFRKTENSSRRLCVGRGNVVAIIKEMYARYAELNNKPEVTVTFRASNDIINLYFDKDVLETIMNNLVSNAMKYTPRGEIAISVDRTECDGTRWVEICVADTGYGISARALPHIFEQYYQEKGPHQASGTGIGLALVKSLVELHEGTITVESEVDKGSTFRVRLKEDNTYDNSPHAEVEETPISRPTAEMQESQHNPQKPILLVVEDNHDICQYIADSFKDEFDIKMGENGKEGLDIARKVLPDIIISDVMMPVMDGNEMCKLLKTDFKTSHIPIILLTAKDSMTAKEEGYLAGADSYITKPFVKSLLTSRVHNLLQQRMMLAQAYKESGVSEKESTYELETREKLRQAMSQPDRTFLDKVDTLIDTYLRSDSLDIDKIAEDLNMSNSTLYRKMTALTGLSPNDYLKKYRLAKAERLLREGTYTVAEVGYQIGISTTAYFRKLFKEEYGTTPSEYQKRMKEQ